MQPLAVGKDADVLAQASLVIEHIAAHMRFRAEQVLKRFANCRTWGGERRVRHQLPQMAGEMDFGHGKIPSSNRGIIYHQYRLDRGKRSISLGAIGAAGLRHVGPSAAAFAAERLGAFAHKIDGVVSRHEIVGDADDDAGLAIAGDADDGDDA